MQRITITYMESKAPPSNDAVPCPIPDVAVRGESIAADRYRALYKTIGGPVSWDSRLRLTAEELAAALADPANLLFLLRVAGEIVGLCEFQRHDREAELLHFGLLPAAQGRGLGRYLLDQALRAVWADGAARVWLHTDINDSAKAIPLYQSFGFQIYRVQEEEFPDDLPAESI